MKGQPAHDGKLDSVEAQAAWDRGRDPVRPGRKLKPEPQTNTTGERPPPRLAVENDAARCKEMVDDEIRQILADLAASGGQP